ncbi:MAG: hypothetical protein LBU65_13680 [Planctomycetaceae bacterium]|nr:hypothetical protein [Planctomycetaceae bacterium]
MTYKVQTGEGTHVDGIDYSIRGENGFQVMPANQGDMRKSAINASGVFGWDWTASTWTQFAATDNSDFIANFFENLLLASTEQRLFNGISGFSDFLNPGGDVRFFSDGVEFLEWNENGFEFTFWGRFFEISVGYYTEGETYTVGSETPATPEPATMLTVCKVDEYTG